jgi:putative transposase
MPRGLERRHGAGHDHFVTFSCFHRLPYLATPSARDTFLFRLEAIRQRYGFSVDSYVVMPEHVHLLLSEPKDVTLSVAMQALKISVSRRLEPRPLWQRRYYDFNVFTDRKRIEKRRYMHRNPYVRELVNHPKDWAWSSYRHWAYGEPSVVQVESNWTFAERMRSSLTDSPD